MPLYDFECPKCEFTKEVKISINEKNCARIICINCGTLMKQKVSKLNFRLNGVGWFANEGTGYGITEMERNKNLEIEKKVEEVATNQQRKDLNERKRG